MDVEARLLLDTVALGSALGLVLLVRRRAWSLRFYAAELVVLLGVSVAGLIDAALRPLVAWPAFAAFVAVGIVPAGFMAIARRQARRRNFRTAAAAARAASALLGLPAPLRREAGVYDALEAAERGDETGCRDRLQNLARATGLPPEAGGATLLSVLPLAAGRRWRDLLAALDADPARPPSLLGLEARAAADAGDLRRALRACRAIEGQPAVARASLAPARRWVLASSGRAAFLEEAQRLAMPVLDGPRGTGDLAIGRAYEALGEAENAAPRYAAAARDGRGAVRLDALAGLRRCEERRLLAADLDELETAALLDLEAACRIQARPPEEAPLVRRAAFTLGVAAITAAASIVAMYALGLDTVSLVASGALSAPLVKAEGEWWRLGSAMLLHGGWFHLMMNVSAILVIGVPFESRAGPSRTAIVYVVSGLIGSLASVALNDTPIGVGASGAAMGLIGALLVLAMRRPALFEAGERRRWLSAIWVTVAATIAVGLAEHEAVDNWAHGAGFVAGALAGWLSLPRLAESPVHRAARRLFALALCGVLVDCGVAAAARAHLWRGERTVRAAGVEVVLPAWMRAERAADGVVVARRAPLGLAVQFGRAPAAPSLARLLPSDAVDEDRELLSQLPRTAIRAGDPGSPVGEVRRADGAGYRVVTMRRGDAFAVTLQWIETTGERDFDFEVARIGRTLRAVE